MKPILKLTGPEYRQKYFTAYYGVRTLWLNKILPRDRQSVEISYLAESGYDRLLPSNQLTLYNPILLMTILCGAARGGHRHILDIHTSNARRMVDWSQVMYAASAGKQYELMRELMENLRTYDVLNDVGRYLTDTIVSLLYNNGPYIDEIVELAKSERYELNWNVILIQAASSGNIHMVELALQSGIQTPLKVTYRALVEASQTGHLDIVLKLVHLTRNGHNIAVSEAS